ncbi:GNAT family N-acetyltransferase [Spirulina subsalsa]|uniref:GNAT family N-acetyltransferase n=1 Tax=Spirulina subsalsa TaxID=54311 RepID=UPI0002FD8D95|nr:GNAT family N-acetyltransferase [Spirulina subsalsa]
MEFVAITTEEQFTRAQQDYGESFPLPPQQWQQEKPDLHSLVVEGGDCGGCYSLWWRETPNYQGQKVGFIGHLKVDSRELIPELLARGCQQLRDMGCFWAIAPVDGNTGYSYRIICSSPSDSLFFSEPNLDYFSPEIFVQGGFIPIAFYQSHLCTNLEQIDPRLVKIRHHLRAQNITIRPAKLEIEELQALYPLVRQAFRHNFLYSPLSQGDFIQHYAPLFPLLRPELILIAEQDKKPIGFLLAFPDFNQRQRGETIEQVILKTVAVLPKRDYAGLGNVLVKQCHAIAAKLGYRQVIHALMHEQNPSLNLSLRYAQPFRRYALYGKFLR